MLGLKAERLEIRPFSLGDVAAIKRIYADPEVMRHVGSGAVKTLEETRAELEAYMAHQDRHGFSFWAVCLRESGEVIGDAGLYRNGPDIELGYTLAREQWGRRYGSEAARRCVQAAADLGLGELIALVRRENLASVAILHGLGFVREGEVIAYGRPHDRLRMDWTRWSAVSPTRSPGSARGMETEQTAEPQPTDQETTREAPGESAERQAQSEDPTAPDRGFEDIEAAEGERRQG